MEASKSYHNDPLLLAPEAHLNRPANHQNPCQAAHFITYISADTRHLLLPPSLLSPPSPPPAAPPCLARPHPHSQHLRHLPQRLSRHRSHSTLSAVTLRISHPLHLSHTLSPPCQTINLALPLPSFT